MQGPSLTIFKRNLSFLLLSAFFIGCGYHWTSNPSFINRPTIAVPFVKGDNDGSLTEAIVYALSSSGVAQVKQGAAQYQLQVSIVDSNSQTIGYRRDRQNISGKIKKNLVAAEGRKILVVECILYEQNGDKIASGPIRLQADSDYDYLDGDSLQDLAFINPLGMQQTVLSFSLGQLEPKEAAEEATKRPLNIKIAKKIADVVFNACCERKISSQS